MPGQGFTYLIGIGAKDRELYLPELKAVPHYEYEDSDGYDGKAYVQIAMHPNLGDPVLRRSVSGLAYRARRILFLWTAWLWGAGKPAWVMEVYSVQNVVYWFALAFLLFRWFPPVCFGNIVRWTAVLFSFGLIFSVRSALLDGPSLFLIAVGMALLESNRIWLGTSVLGLAGLGKDTNILSASAIELPKPGSFRSWLKWFAKLALVVGPLLGWVLCITIWIGHGSDIGARNFSFPFAALFQKLSNVVSNLLTDGQHFRSIAKYDLLVLIGLVTQFFFFTFRMRWRDRWWRMGISFSALMVFLGESVWEGYPTAASRILLPMTLAFNILVPRVGWWPLVLILGNLGVVGSVDILTPPSRESFRVEGPVDLRMSDGKSVEVAYGRSNWCRPEASRLNRWCWSTGDCSITIKNPQHFAMSAELRFKIKAADSRNVTLSSGNEILSRTALKPYIFENIDLPAIELPPGDTVFLFHSDRPARAPDENDKRLLTFSLWELRVILKQKR